MRLFHRRALYHGKRKYGWLLTVLCIAVIVIIAYLLWLFTTLQSHLIYDNDGAHLVYDSESSESEAEAIGEDDTLFDVADTTEAVSSDEEQIATAEPVDVNLIVDAPDFTDVNLRPETEPGEIRALYISTDMITADSLSYYADVAMRSSQNAIVMTLKDSSGMFSYLSGVSLSASYGVNGQEYIADAIEEIKSPDEDEDSGSESGSSKSASSGLSGSENDSENSSSDESASVSANTATVSAVIYTLQDTAMGIRNSPVALTYANGAAATDESGIVYLDPYNAVVREYYEDIISDLARIGVDEIIFSGLCLPQDGTFNFCIANAGALDSVSAVSTFAKFLVETCIEKGVTASVLVDGTYIRQELGTNIGQDYEFFGRIFSRIYLQSNAGDYTVDSAALESAVGNSNVPIVPFCSDFTPEVGSYVR